MQLKLGLVKTSPEFETRYEQLNPEQRKAVDSIEGPQLVIAGPGTGKTEIIAMRIAKILIDTQLHPSNVLCLTFTEVGVSAMRNRLIQIIGADAHAVGVYTFHGFANEVITNSPERFPELGYNAVQIAEIGKIDLLKKEIDKLGSGSVLRPFRKPYTFLNALVRQISALKRENISPETYKHELSELRSFFVQHGSVFKRLLDVNARKLTDKDFEDFLQSLTKGGLESYSLTKGFDELIVHLLKAEIEERSKKSLRTQTRAKIRDVYWRYDKNFISKQEEFITVYEGYQKALRVESKYDYEDMIMLVVNKFKEDKELLRDYQEKYQYLLIDEYQDTNSAQNETVFELGSFFSNPNIFVVGDDDQSIFRFQGASLENLMEFYKRYRKFLSIVVLKSNYRSQQTILDASRELIETNQHRAVNLIDGLDKNLVGVTNSKRRKLVVSRFTSEVEESSSVAKKIKQLIQDGTEPEMIAVIYRDNKDAVTISHALTSEAINFKLDRGENVLGDKYISLLIDLLTYLNDPTDDALLYKVLNFEFLGFSGLDLAKLAQYRYKQRISLTDLLADLKLLEATKMNNADKAYQTYVQLTELSKKIQTESAVLAFEQVLTDKYLGILPWILQLDDRFHRIVRINRFVSEIKTQAEGDSSYTVQQFLEHLQLLRENNIRLEDKVTGANDDSVRLMTAHGAKGQEFEHVFMIKCTNRKWDRKVRGNKIGLVPGLLETDLVDRGLEEERRLFYVALTRARLAVYLSYADYDDQERQQTESIFVTQISPEFVERNKVVSSEKQLDEILTNTLTTPSPQDYTLDGRKFLEGILDEYKLSATHFQSYSSCPRCFYFNTLLRIPRLKTPYMAFGTAIHETLKQTVIEFKRGKRLPGKGFVDPVFADVLAREFLSAKDFNHYLNQGKKILNAYLEEKSEDFNPDSLVEYNFYSHNVELKGVPITGKIDRIDFADNKQQEVVVVDYKTGNPDRANSKLKFEKEGDYIKQIYFYKLLIENSALTDWKVTGGLVSYVERSKRRNKYFDFHVTFQNDEEMKLIEEIQNVYVRIQALDFEECGEKCEFEWFHELPWKI